MNKWFVTLVVGLMFGTAWPVKADLEPIQKIMGKAETVQKKATAAQEKIMTYKKEIEEQVKKAKDAMAEAQGMANDVKGAINDAKSMSDAVTKGDFSSFNVMPADLKTAMADVKQAKNDVSSKVNEAQSMAAEAKEVSSGAAALASQSISDAQSQAGIGNNNTLGGAAAASGLSSVAGGSVKNTAELSSVQKDTSISKATLSAAVNTGGASLQTVGTAGQKNVVADVNRVTLDKAGGATLSSSNIVTNPQSISSAAQKSQVVNAGGNTLSKVSGVSLSSSNMATSPQVVSTAQKSQAESVSSNSLSKAGGATLSSANMAIVGSQPVSSAGLKVNEEISSEGMKLSNEMLSAQEELKPVTSLETKQEVIGRKAFTLATEEEKTEENKLDEAKKVSAITSVSGKEEMITPDKNLLVAPQKASLTKEVTGIQKVETPKAEAEKVTLPTTDSKSLTAPAKAKISGTAASATKTVSEPVKSLSQQSQTGKKDTLNSNTLTAPQAPAKALQKNSFWLDETSPMTLKVAQIDTLTFADEADSNQSPEELSEAVGETFLPKEGEGDSVEEIKRAKESMQEFMRNEVTALYATGFTIRTNMMKEPENRDVDMENENQMWKETILKAEDCITRIAKIHVMEAMLSSYRYSEALQDLVVQQTESLESEEE